MEDIKKSIKALKMALDVEKDSELCDALKISYSAIDAWKRRGKLPAKYEKYIHSDKKNSSNTVVNGNNNVTTSGHGNTVKTSFAKQTHEITPQIQDICQLLQEYASPKFLNDLQEKLLKIKELHE